MALRRGKKKSGKKKVGGGAKKLSAASKKIAESRGKSVQKGKKSAQKPLKKTTRKVAKKAIKKTAGSRAVYSPAEGPLQWLELNCPNPQKALAFYQALFGWTSNSIYMDEIGPYHLLKSGSSPEFAGIIPISEDSTTPHWIIYFRSDDLNSSIRRAEELGGEIIHPPQNSPAGRYAFIKDPSGATFALLEPLSDDKSSR